MSDPAGEARVRSRLFVAVTPPDDVLDAIAALPRPAEPGVRWTKRPAWHVTLRFLGNDVDVLDAIAAVGALDAAPAVAEVGPAVSRLGRNVVCLPVAGLDALAAAVRDATAGVGDPPEQRRFAGHLTLARLKHRAACGVAGTPFRARFDVPEVELVRSTLGDRGPTYEVLARRLLAA
ncbi:MAG: RNA 2',3'-cyclic phosphodiesterase [Acidimicrobiales bacterium]